MGISLKTKPHHDRSRIAGNNVHHFGPGPSDDGGSTDGIDGATDLFVVLRNPAISLPIN